MVFKCMSLPRAYGCFLSIFFSCLVFPSLSEGAKRSSSVALFQPESDPLASKDPFVDLSEKDKKRWSHSEDAGVEAKFKALKDLESIVSIQIKLVGFDGHGNLDINVNEADMQKFSDILKTDPHVDVIRSEVHEMMVKRKMAFHVSKATTDMARDVSSAISQAIHKVPVDEVARGGALPISPTEVDKVVAADYSHDGEGYVIYLLNPLQQKGVYSYTYSNDHSCHGTFFAGKERYIWVDLTAGPVSYGPMEEGEGLVTYDTFVQAQQFPRDQLRKAFLAHLVSLVAGATKYLISPSMYHAHVPFALNTEVRIVHFKSSMVDTPNRDDLNIGAIKAAAQRLLLPKQELDFQISTLFLPRCAFCTAAYSRSLRSESGRVLQSGHALEVQQYLDSEELHHLLAEFWPEIKTSAGVHDPPFLDPELGVNGRVIPVFVFDLDTEDHILLDRSEQAVAYDDMVIAVRTRSREAPVKYQCNSEVIKTDLSNVSRPILAALLQTGWGVSPTYASWSSFHNRSVEDYRWSVGPTPFGPFSQQLELSFSHQDAAVRNIILTLLNDTISDVFHTLHAIKGYGGEDVAIMKGTARTVYKQRWNLVKHKLKMSCNALSLLQFGHALYYVRSAHHDATLLYETAKSSAQNIQTTISCFREPTTEWWWYASILLTGFGVGFLWVRREEIFSVKHKQF